ncbi:MAG: hypothetical protein WA254_02035, partial [Candidatus Sulfotelmatobacter sp.]
PNEGPMQTAGSVDDAGVRGAAGKYRGPFDKLRAGSSARKNRVPQDDSVVVLRPCSCPRKNLSIGKNYTIGPKSLTVTEI